MKLHVLGIDLGKTVFHRAGLDSTSRADRPVYRDEGERIFHPIRPNTLTQTNNHLVLACNSAADHTYGKLQVLKATFLARTSSGCRIGDKSVRDRLVRLGCSGFQALKSTWVGHSALARAIRICASILFPRPWIAAIF
jgi:hypothetical protein